MQIMIIKYVLSFLYSIKMYFMYNVMKIRLLQELGLMWLMP